MNKQKNRIAGVLKGENTMLLFAVALFAVDSDFHQRFNCLWNDFYHLVRRN